MDQLLAYFLKMFGIEPSIARITAPITKIVNDLNNFVVISEAAGIEARMRSDKLKADALTHTAAAKEAATLAQSYSKLVA